MAKNRWTKWASKNIPLIIITTFMAGWLGATYYAQRNAPLAIGQRLGLRETVAPDRLRTPTPCPCVDPTRQTPTPQPGRGTRTAEPETVTPAVTETPPLTATPVIGGTLTTTPAPPIGDVCRDWHAYGFDPNHPTAGPHHHGYNPCDYVGIFGDGLAEYLAEHGPVGYPYSSPTEEHHGYVWLYLHLETCEQFANVIETSDLACVRDVLLRIHAVGNTAHNLKRFHSEVAFVNACADKQMTNCGVAGPLMQLVDYGVIFNPYKQAICHVAGQEPLLANGQAITDLNQPPYRGLQPPDLRDAPIPASWNDSEFLVSEIWSSLRIAANSAYYPHDPNSNVQVAWTIMDSKEYFECGAPGEMPSGVSAAPNDASRFMLFTVKVLLSNFPRPYVGFTDVYGHPSDCGAVSDVCYPIRIEADFPTANAFMNFSVAQNGSNPTVIQHEFNP